MPTPIKHPTGWRPTSGQGTVVLIGLVPIITNAVVRIVTNSSILPIFTSPTVTKPKHAAIWTPQG